MRTASFSRLTLCFASMLCLTACGDQLTDIAVSPNVASPSDYWALRFTDRAINLSVATPTNTVQLEATPRNAAGEILSGVTATPTFRSLTPEVAVSPTGLLTALEVGSSFPVVAEWEFGGITLADTALVYVTDTAPTVIPSTLSIDPLAPDSAKWSLQLGTKVITPHDANGDAISGIAVAYSSSDLNVADVITSNGSDPSQGFLAAVSPGTATITASTYAYGMRLTGQTTYTIGYPTFQYITIAESAGPGGVGTIPVFLGSPEVTIGIGGQVVFNTLNMTGTTGIAVEDVAGGPAPFCTGDLTALPPAFFATFCFFPSAGTYRYRTLVGDATGTITVKADTP